MRIVFANTSAGRLPITNPTSTPSSQSSKRARAGKIWSSSRIMCSQSRSLSDTSTATVSRVTPRADASTTAASQACMALASSMCSSAASAASEQPLRANAGKMKSSSADEWELKTASKSL